MAVAEPKLPTGVYARHRRKCRSRSGGECSCEPTYQAQAWSAHDKKPLRKTFASFEQAKAWRQEAQIAIRQRKLSAPSERTLNEAATEWLEGAKAGTIRTKAGRPYKPSVIRGYRIALTTKLQPKFGHKRLTAITRNQLQDFADELVGKSYAPESVRNAIAPLRAIYRRAIHREEVVVNPTRGLEFPAIRRTRDRVVPPKEATALLDALPESDRAIWACAIYAGLRRGELMALRWQDVDLDKGVISVLHGWDRDAGLIEPKSAAAERRVPIASTLRAYLLSQRLRQGAGGKGFVFSTTGEIPFDPPTISERADRAWKSAGLRRVCLHECRHTYASLMIAAGVNAKALSTYMGHSTITLTLDRYGHLLPGNEREAASSLDAYLSAAEA